MKSQHKLRRCNILWKDKWNDIKGESGRQSASGRTPIQISTPHSYMSVTVNSSQSTKMCNSYWGQKIETLLLEILLETLDLRFLQQPGGTAQLTSPQKSVLEELDFRGLIGHYPNLIHVFGSIINFDTYLRMRYDQQCQFFQTFWHQVHLVFSNISLSQSGPNIGSRCITWGGGGLYSKMDMMLLHGLGKCTLNKFPLTKSIP